MPLVLIMSKNVRANNLQEFIAEMRAAPGKYTFGGGIGSPPHIIGAWFNRVNNLNVTHIPYRGGGQAVADVVGGHIDMFYAGARGRQGRDRFRRGQGARGDRRRALVGAAERADIQGGRRAKDFELASWNVMLVPKGTPADDRCARCARRPRWRSPIPKIREIYVAQGVEASPTPGREGVPRSGARQVRPGGAQPRHHDGVALIVLLKTGLRAEAVEISSFAVGYPSSVSASALPSHGNLDRLGCPQREGRNGQGRVRCT